jgi:hypothetical protein
MTLVYKESVNALPKVVGFLGVLWSTSFKSLGTRLYSFSNYPAYAVINSVHFYIKLKYFENEDRCKKNVK